MKKTFNLLLIILCLTSLQFVSTINAETYAAFGGEYTSDNIRRGDTVTFFGSVWNNNTEPGTKILFMNVTLTRTTATEPTAKFVKEYEPNRQNFPSLSVFSDSITEKLDYEPGLYNVSILFMLENPSVIVAERIQPYYALTNETMLIRGVTQPLQFLYALLVLAGVVFLLFIFIIIQRKRE
jgi:hypothetical protein